MIISIICILTIGIINCAAITYTKMSHNILDPNFINVLTRLLIALYLIIIHYNAIKTFFTNKLHNKLYRVYDIIFISIADVLKIAIINHIVFKTNIFLNAFYLINSFEAVLILFFVKEPTAYNHIIICFLSGLIGLCFMCVKSLVILKSIIPLILLIIFKTYFLVNIKNKLPFYIRDICCNICIPLLLIVLTFLINEVKDVPYFGSILQTYATFSPNPFILIFVSLSIAIMRFFVMYVNGLINTKEKYNFFVTKYIQIIMCNFVSIILINFINNQHTSVEIIDIAVFFILSGLNMSFYFTNKKPLCL